MPDLDPVARDSISHVEQILARVPPDDLAAARRAFQAVLDWLRGAAAPDTSGIAIAGSRIAGVEVRHYQPLGAPGGEVVVFIHGGGWNAGDLATAHPNVVPLVRATGSHVVSVDYRLAPEHPFPAAFEDCLAVLRHLSREGRVFMAGDSAGGNLAAALSAYPGTSVAGQLLIYPALDPSMQSDSYRRYAKGCPLTADGVAANYRLYLPDGPSREDPRAAPWRSSRIDLPPTIICTAGCDPLHDEAVGYAAHLQSLGVAVSLLPAPTLPHGWLEFVEKVPAAAAARDAAYSAFSGLMRSVRERAPLIG